MDLSSQSDADCPDNPETVIIGAGPAGLTAGLTLRKGGHAPLILECTDNVGGLMRSPRWGNFILDLGRKELYARFPEIDAIWSEILRDDYRLYPHRVGSLYRGHIVEMSGRYRGPLRGMPFPWLVAGGFGLATGIVRGAMGRPRTLRDYWYGRVGGPFARIFAQGYWEKFRGRAWVDMDPPEQDPAGESKGPWLFSTAAQVMRIARRGGVSGQVAWRHPLRGTGQLFEGLAAAYAGLGGRIEFGAKVVGLTPGTDGVEVDWVKNGSAHRRTVAQVVSPMPVEKLWSLVAPRGSADAVTLGPEAERAVLLVYLMLSSPPRFPHAWLEVNDTALRCGRIVNYAAFGGDMVPTGQTALCVEYFCAGDSPVLAMSKDEQVELALSEVEGAGLLDRQDLLGAMVLKLSRTNAAASWREQQSAHRTTLFERLRAYPRIYHVNRPGSDWASLAGLQAARAILADDRASFDMVADPTRRQEDNLRLSAV